MKSLLKNILRPLYYYVKSKQQREFYRLLDTFGYSQRFIMTKNVHFLNYTFNIPDGASFIGQFKEIFVDEIYKFETKNTIPVIFDCGSNIGTSLLYFRENHPNAKIIGFEADDTIATLSIENLKKNNITDITVISSAVWIDNKGIEFSTEGADGGSIKGEHNLKKVPSIRLKDFLLMETSIDFLKMDIEGAEYEVIQDCADALSHVENIFIEYHSWNHSIQTLGDILHILEKNGFRYYIEDISKRKHPLINKNISSPMDLQLNIFGYKTK